MNKNLGVYALAVCLVFATAGVSAKTKDKLKITSGLDYSSGDYGDPVDTEIWYAPLTFKYDSLPWIFKVTIPYLRIRGPGTVVGGGDVIGGGGLSRTTEEGLGDVVASVTYALPKLGKAWPWIDVTGKLKLPTADEDKRLGTGKTDVTIKLDAFNVYGRWTPLATVGRKFRGGTDTLRLNDTWFASAGLMRKFTKHFTAGLIGDFKEPSSQSSTDVQELMLFSTVKLDPNWSLNAYAVQGFTQSSVDLGLGLQLSYRTQWIRGRER